MPHAGPIGFAVAIALLELWRRWVKTGLPRWVYHLIWLLFLGGLGLVGHSEISLQGTFDDLSKSSVPPSARQQALSSGIATAAVWMLIAGGALLFAMVLLVIGSVRRPAVRTKEMP